MEELQDQNNSTQEEETDVKNNVPSFKLDYPITGLNTNLITSDNLTSCNQDSILSLVVPGEDLISVQDVEAQASLIASCVDAHQKSMSVDYKLIVSSMSADEMQQRLVEILEENAKLKETLKMTNAFTMQNLKNLMLWQEEVTKVHDIHKQKFAEMQELIQHLKKENPELKANLAEPQYSDSMGFEAINTSENLSHTSQAELEQSAIPTLVETVDNSCATSKQADEEHPCDKLESSIEKEPQCVTEKLSCSQIFAEMSASHNCSEACSTKDEKIADLQKVVALLEQKLQCASAPIQQSDVTELSTPNREKLTQVMNQYYDVSQNLRGCFMTQINHFDVIEQILEESIDALKMPDDSTLEERFHDCKQKLCHYSKQLSYLQRRIITDRDTFVKLQNKFYKMLSECKSVFYELEMSSNENGKLNVWMKNIGEREKLKILEQMEEDIKLEELLLQEEESKLKVIKVFVKQEKLLVENQRKSFEAEQKSARDEKTQEKIGLDEEKMDQLSYFCEKLKILEQMEEDIKLEEQTLQEKESTLEQRKVCLKEEKLLLEKQKKSFDAEQEFFCNEKKLLAPEEIELSKEKMSLDQQGYLYENSKKMLEEEKKILASPFQDLEDKIN